jgi:hypothetical protein
MKLPSSSGPDIDSVLNAAASRSACSISATALGGAETSYARLIASSACTGDAPSRTGNDAGTSSQIRPQSVSVWVVVVLGLGASAEGARLAPGDPAGLAPALADGVGVGAAGDGDGVAADPQAADSTATIRIATTVGTRPGRAGSGRGDRADIGPIVGRSAGSRAAGGIGVTARRP